MTDRDAIVARVTRVVEELLFAPYGSVKPDLVLMERIDVDSMDMIEIGQAVEQEFFADDTTVILDAEPNWTVDKIADLVIEKLAAKEAAAN